MSVIHVAVPMLRGRSQFKVEKGRRWSVVEHLMLDAVADRPAPAAELAAKSNLPRRIVVEAFIRLMRVGWVEIASGSEGPIFRATPSGRVQAGSLEMRAATTLQRRWMGFSVDCIAGSVFRGREVIVRSLNKINVPANERLVITDPSPRHSAADLAEVFAAIENEDEVILGMESISQPLFRGYAVFKVRDGTIESLSSRARDGLRSAILSAAGVVGPAARPLTSAGHPATSMASSHSVGQTMQALFDHDDVVVDGPGHRDMLESILTRARRRVLIHSTFVSPSGWRPAVPLLLGAASRGAKIQVFWGHADDASGASSSRSACDALRKAVAEAGRSDDVIVHPFSTGSHAKLLIADDGRGGWSAVVGSCNWLSTDFASFEASLRMRDPLVVGQLVRHIAALSIGPDGIYNRTVGDLTVLGREISAMPRPKGRMAKVRLLLAPDHAELVLDARDRLERRLLVTSHRFGISGKPLVIIPALAAAQTKGVSVKLYYGRPTGRLSGIDAAAITLEMKRGNVDIRPVEQPRIHSKVLAWDDDALAVTSLNWLSADPSQTATRSEIGVAVEANKIADTFIRRFELATACSTS
jgi:cardiolipin synthase A/B